MNHLFRSQLLARYLIFINLGYYKSFTDVLSNLYFGYYTLGSYSFIDENTGMPTARVHVLSTTDQIVDSWNFTLSDIVTTYSPIHLI